MPLASVGDALLSSFVQSELEKLFHYRDQIQKRDLSLYSSQSKKKCFLLTGSGGLIGHALRVFLLSQGHEVKVLGYASSPKEGCWSLSQDMIEEKVFEGVDTVIHLAGEGIANKRWSTAQKQRIADSRILGTQLFARSISRLANPPSAFLCASACGFYDPSYEELDESCGVGSSFLATTCKKWEEALNPIKDLCRCVHLRFGVVLDPRGGALKQMLPPFKIGLGGPLGSGKQIMSWISLEDVIKAIYHLCFNTQESGPFNLTAPHPLAQKDFAKTLAKTLGRPYGVPLPAFVAKLMFGEMAEALLLAPQRVVPSRLLKTGYHFIHPTLNEALKELF